MASMDMTGSSTALLNATYPSVYMPDSYFKFSEHSGLMLAHITFMTIGWLGVLPIGVMLSIARSRLVIPTQFAFLTLNALGLVFGATYNSRTPDFYENNAHHKLGWAVSWMLSIQVFLGLLQSYARRNNTTKDLSFNTAAKYVRRQDLRNTQGYRYSRDSGQGTEPSSPRTSLPVTSQDFGDAQPTGLDGWYDADNEEPSQEKYGLLSTSVVNRFIVQKIPWTQGIKYISWIYNLIDRTILILGFIALLTGGVTYGGIFKSHGIFSGLAHFIKGGIFLWYGLLTLGRYCGCFADLGWAWNIRSREGALPSAEFVESFLIFFYGSTNVFLEHLGEWGHEWSAGDLEHVSISILFFSGGLCGMLVESRRTRELLNSAFTASLDSQAISTSLDLWQLPKTYAFSTNPLPGIIILLLGILMSSHHQTSMVSAMLHKQWGTLFVSAALARGITYILMYLSPPTSLLPSRPPSELVVAFCLISGGLLFMSSNEDMVAALEAHQLNAMFVFTIMMAVTSALMAWTIILLAVKAWAVRWTTYRCVPSNQLA